MKYPRAISLIFSSALHNNYKKKRKKSIYRIVKLDKCRNICGRSLVRGIFAPFQTKIQFLCVVSGHTKLFLAFSAKGRNCYYAQNAQTVFPFFTLRAWSIGKRGVIRGWQDFRRTSYLGQLGLDSGLGMRVWGVRKRSRRLIIRREDYMQNRGKYMEKTLSSCAVWLWWWSSERKRFNVERSV